MSLANQVTEEIELSVVTGDVMSPADGFGAKLKAIRRDLREEYLQPHDKPWIIGFSGGKDSTLLAHLVIECLLAIPPDERKRRVYLVCNDTLVLGGGTTNRPNLLATASYPKPVNAWFSASSFADPVAPWNGGPNQGFTVFGYETFASRFGRF